MESARAEGEAVGEGFVAGEGVGEGGEFGLEGEGGLLGVGAEFFGFLAEEEAFFGAVFEGVCQAGFFVFGAFEALGDFFLAWKVMLEMVVPCGV